MPDVQLLNRTNFDRISYTTLGVPFERGQLSESDSLSVSNATSPTVIDTVQWYPQGARWDDGSIKYAKCTFPCVISADSNKQVSIFRGTGSATPFFISQQVLDGFNDTKVVVRINPKKPRIVKSGISNIRKVTFDEKTWAEITLSQPYLNNTRAKSDASGVVTPDASYYVRIEGLQQGSTTGFTMLNSSNYSGNRAIAKLGYTQTPLDYTKIYIQSTSSNPLWENTTPGPYSTSVNAGATLYSEFWDFTPLGEMTIEIDLENDPYTILEGDPSSNDHYVRYKYFKRLDAHPEWTGTKKIFLEFVVDKLKSTKHQRWWAKVGNSLWEDGYIRPDSSTRQLAGNYPHGTTFFTGDVILSFESKSGSSAPRIHMRDWEYQTYGKTEQAGSTQFVILRDLGEKVKSWVNSQGTITSTDTYRSLHIPHTDAFFTHTVHSYKGVMLHDGINSMWEGELHEDVLSIAMNWDGLYPPYGTIAPNPSWIASRAQGIAAMDTMLAGYESKKLYSYPYQYGLIGSYAGCNAGGTQPSFTGGQQGYFIMRTGWPSFIPLLEWRSRMEFTRPQTLMMEDGSLWQAASHRARNGGKVIIFESELYQSTFDAGGMGDVPGYSYSSHPQGPIIGPINGNKIFQGRQRHYGLVAKSSTVFDAPAVVKTYAMSHMLMQWTTMAAYLSMDYLAINVLESYLQNYIIHLDPESSSESIYGCYKAARELGRPAFTGAQLYELFADDELLELLKAKWGGETHPRSAWSVSGTKYVLDRPSDYPNPVNGSGVWGPWQGFARGYLLSCESFAGSWMEGEFSYGVFALYKTLLALKGSEAAFDTEEQNIATLIKHQAANALMSGFILDCTDTIGAKEHIEFSSSAYWEDDPTQDVSLLAGNSPVVFQAEPGDIVYLASDPTAQAEVLIMRRDDHSSYIKTGYTFDTQLRTPNTNWTFSYVLVLTNKTKPFPVGNYQWLVNSANGSRVQINVARKNKGWLCAYGVHMGWDGIQGADSYIFTDVSAPALPTGTVMTDELLAVPTPYDYRLDALDPSSGGPALQKAGGRLQKADPRYWKVSGSLTQWAWATVAVAFYFANRDAYGANNDDVYNKAVAAIEAIKNYQINEPSDGTFDLNVHPFMAYIDGILEVDGPTVRAGSTDLRFTVPAPTLDADTIVNLTYPVGYAASGEYSVFSPTIDIDGNKSVRHFPQPLSMQFNSVGGSIYTDDYRGATGTPNSNNMGFTTVSPFVFTQVISPSTNLNWTRYLSLYLEAADELIPDPLLGLFGDESFGSNRKDDPLTSDDIILTSNSLDPKVMLEFNNIDVNSPNYSGPYGYWNLVDGDNIVIPDPTGTGSGEKVSFDSYLSSDEYIVYFSPEDTAPIT